MFHQLFSYHLDNINEMIASGRVEIQNHSYNMHSLATEKVVNQTDEGEKLIWRYETAFTQDLSKAQNADYWTK